MRVEFNRTGAERKALVTAIGERGCQLRLMTLEDS